MLIGTCKLELFMHEEAQRHFIDALNMFHDLHATLETQVEVEVDADSVTKVQVDGVANHARAPVKVTYKHNNKTYSYYSYCSTVSFITNVYVASCYNQLGTVYAFFEEYHDAITNYNYAIQIYSISKNVDLDDSVTGDKHMAESIEISNVYNNLATLYDDMVSLCLYGVLTCVVCCFHLCASLNVLL